MNSTSLPALPGRAGNASMGHAKKDLGMGMPPGAFGDTVSAQDAALMAQCNPQAKLVVVEVARWTSLLPLADAAIGTTFNGTMNVWGTASGNPPPGVAFAFNTLSTPGVLPQDMVLLGLSVRVLVDPEGRRIRGNFYLNGGSTVFPGSPDALSVNDATRALGLPGGTTLTKADLLYGFPGWKAAYAFINAHELVWLKNHQDQLIREPLTQVAHVEPFAMAEAAGTAFGSNADRINEFNGRIASAAVGQPGIFLPTTHTRTGSRTDGGGNNFGTFSPTRQDDASPTIFGGVGVTQNMLQHDPYLFSQPIYWPAAIPFGIQFQAYDPTWLAEFQRWLSVTGGTNGAAGLDLALPVQPAGPPQIGNVAPSVAPTGDIMQELTSDVPPITAGEQIVTTTSICKLGRMVFEIGLIGRRIPETWKGVVYRAVMSGAMQAPGGLGNLPAFKTAA